MNPQFPNSVVNGAADKSVSDAEATLRLIAALPAPAGLEDRVHRSLRAGRKSGNNPGPVPGADRVLAWRMPLGSPKGSAKSWLRSAAAAAIAFVVVGGGWGVYSRVQQPGGAATAPLRAAGQISVQISSPGGFGGAGAIRMPQTLNGPVLTHAVQAKKKAKKLADAHKASGPVAPAAQ